MLVSRGLGSPSIILLWIGGFGLDLYQHKLEENQAPGV